MSSKIEETLNLPKLEDLLKEENDEVATMATALQNYETIDLLSEEETLRTTNAEMNELYENAIKAHKDMVDLGFNVESRHAGSIFEPAARMLEIALTASKNKSDQKIKLLRLQLEQKKLEAKLSSEKDIYEAAPDGSFVALRSDLIKQLRDLAKPDS